MALDPPARPSEKTTYAEMVTRTEATATEITRLDPQAIVVGA